jgi:hypothetical protein
VKQAAEIMDALDSRVRAATVIRVGVEHPGAECQIDFERVMARLREALMHSEQPQRRDQARGSRVVRVAKPLPDGNIAYVHVINPVVAGTRRSVNWLSATGSRLHVTGRRRSRPRLRFVGVGSAEHVGETKDAAATDDGGELLRVE